MIFWNQLSVASNRRLIELNNRAKFGEDWVSSSGSTSILKILGLLPLEVYEFPLFFMANHMKSGQNEQYKSKHPKLIKL